MELSISDIKELLGANQPPLAASSLTGLRVLVRTHNSGVSIGTLDHVRPFGNLVEMQLSNAVRIWRWSGAFTCSELAANGGECRVARHPSPLVLFEQAAEVLPVSDTAWDRIQSSWTEGAE